MVRIVALALLLAAGGCKNKKSSGDQTETEPEPVAVEPDEDSGDERTSAEPNEPPGFELPAHQRVGVGQEIGFGLEVVDEESDEIVVELVEKPASATFDPYTLTVVWKPTGADMPQGQFAVRISEKRRDGGGTRVFLHRFAIEVARQPQPLPAAQPLGPAVETLITIHDPDRLERVNREWPLDVMLERAARSAHSELPEAERETVEVASRKELYRSFLRQLAAAHHNPTVDPESERFDEELWADPADWKIIAVRPRLDKKWHEVRIVYRAKAHAATYTMFKFRPVADAEAPETALAINNKEMARLTVEAFFQPDGTLDAALYRDKKAHADRVASFVRNVLEYQNPDLEWHSATFLGLPTEARLGGGNRRDADGGYVSGDAWGWNVMKAKAKADKMLMHNVPIKGFATAVAPSEDNGIWEMKCAPRFDPDSDAHDPRFTSLCRDTGHVDLPATGDGYAEAGAEGEVVSSMVDAVNLFVDHKYGAMVESVPLEDPRRDLFEEKGMTCSQCHVRKFGVRDMYDRAAYDPGAGEPEKLNKSQATTYFVIVPTERWQPYAIDFQHKQECKFKAAIETALEIETSLGCPLKAE